MRRLLFLGVGGVLLIAVGGGPAHADNGPHVSSAGAAGFDQITGSDRCDGCHRSRTAQGAFLLTAGHDGLCLTCHGSSAGGASTDVVDGIGYEAAGTQREGRNNALGALRGGGFEYAMIGSASATKDTYLCGSSLLARNQKIPVLAAGQVTTSSHRVTGATSTVTSTAATSTAASGTGASAEVVLQCGSCHNPHGNGNYRILRPIPVSSGTSAPAAAVRIPDSSVKVYTTSNYWLTGDASVPPVLNGFHQGTDVPDGFIGNIAQWCTTCHTSRHADPDSKMGVGTNCITCHVAHDSNASISGARAGATMSGASAGQPEVPDGPAAPCVSSRLLRVDNGAACMMCHNV